MMGTEIERKFLVKNDSWRKNATGIDFRQGYLSLEEKRSVRIRVSGQQAYLTIKGKSVGAKRAEFEYAIPVDDAHQILDELCQRPLIEKTRYKIEHKGVTWEVDEFKQENDGLLLAEVELESETQEIDFPEWVGREVTGDPRYLNVNLVKHPYREW